MKGKSALRFTPVVDDCQARPFADLQEQLDIIQDNGMTAFDIRSVLFSKMLDLHNVPKDHYLRDLDTPERLDDPSIIEQLNAMGFYRTRQYAVH